MIYFSAVGMVNALGGELDEIAKNLAAGRSPGMTLREGWLTSQQPVWLGQVLTPLPAVPDALMRHRTRNNQLLMAALKQIRPQVDSAIAQYGRDRVAVVMGTSTSGIAEGEDAIQFIQAEGDFPAEYAYQQQELGDPSQFLSRLLDLEGASYTLSTACTSSARAIISGQRLIEAGLADVALVGGADSLCRMPVNGFASLEALSSTRCTPFAAERDGINIGEGAVLILLTREPAPVALLGVGESSDAWHMSAPHPQGEGAERAIRMAMEQAKITADSLGYINLHGTATEQNDRVEAQVIQRLFADRVPCSSTKHLTGHTLGAAGATEAALSWLILSRNIALPQQDFSHSVADPALGEFGLVTREQTLQKAAILSNSFAFGGNNASILLGKPQ
ncbi:beta-ketoacyl-[acyl-carrier-protein] synthase family protein [Rouxiella badensis]|uniref:Beta-ketoacyl-[acyl-carrier-protein] synthase II n=1 Tax=Rouxiella badensis TaxID=1646377 RepID=A0A1X0WCU3_9GAMM|nr:beta-ketoacyl-[acyl-carrier-protein] synthase family protein [Rouxiella badensis]ORJ24571.1 beta-ketoacyl-[acyl-carrier-protein] synthase II [Rouxiella badensis]QII37909.1 beta-ketoacyl-[acyl-carrier-protein] synthase family protein [Rouxiella badensis]